MHLQIKKKDGPAYHVSDVCLKNANFMIFFATDSSISYKKMSAALNILKRALEQQSAKYKILAYTECAKQTSRFLTGYGKSYIGLTYFLFLIL